MEATLELEKVEGCESVAAERSVIGAILLTEGKALDACKGVIEGESFTNSRYQTIFDVAMMVYTSGKPVDLVTLEEALTDSGKLGSCGGTDAIIQITEDTVSPGNVSYHIELVRKAWAKRRSVRELKRLIYTLEGGKDPFEQMKRTANVLNLVMKEAKPRDEIEKWVSEAFSDTSSDIKFGYDKLDKITGGITRKEVTVIGARPSNGKTSFIVDLACNVLNQGKRVCIVSKEMPAFQLIRKIAARQWAINPKELTEEEKAHFADKTTDLIKNEWESRLHILENIQSPFKVPHLTASMDVDLILDDYIQYGLYSKETRLDVTKAMNMYKNIAGERNIACVVAAQLNRESVKRDNPEPRNDDLAESGGIEQFAANIILLHYPSRCFPGLFDKEDYKILVGKARYGEPGTIPFRFEGALCRFTEKGEEDKKQMNLGLDFG